MFFAHVRLWRLGARIRGQGQRDPERAESHRIKFVRFYRVKGANACSEPPERARIDTRVLHNVSQLCGPGGHVPHRHRTLQEEGMTGSKMAILVFSRAPLLSKKRFFRAVWASLFKVHPS